MMAHPSPVGKHHAVLSVDRRSYQHIDPHLPSRGILSLETLAIPLYSLTSAALFQELSFLF